MSTEDNSLSATPATSRNGRRLALVCLAALVLAVYFTRVTFLPVSGEEGRWARGAVRMIETGDWIVARQQGEVFPERPPLGSWAMAVGGLLRGEVDDVAIRLPSLIAILLTSILIFYYASSYLSTFGAFAAGAVYATFGQVMEIGRMGESESLFALFVSGSLLLWHHGYMRWRPFATWSVAYSLMALGALVKGPQAPVYFGAVVFLFLAVRRDWRYLFSWAHVLGITCAATVVGAWQIPYYLATDINAVVATWAGLAGDRFTIAGVLAHASTYPLETLACLLPWSPLLIVYAKRSFRKSITAQREMILFLLVALAITYPTVWFATGARGRYYMPLYPIVAILIGLVVQKCAEAVAGASAKRDWNRFSATMAVVMAVVGVGILYISFASNSSLVHFRQPLWYAIAFAIMTSVGSGVLIWTVRKGNPQRVVVAFATICVFAGLMWSGIVLNMQKSRWNDIGPKVADARAKLPSDVRLVSFTPADHRFCYFYRDFIGQLDWPESIDDVLDDVEYFCVNHFLGDTPQWRTSGRGRSWTKSPGTLPFEWEEVARVPCDRKVRETPYTEVIIGRIVRKTNVASKPSGQTK
jgi:4-amino-4-deoxy-L-arabinose transferase-like glycosyltransferase